MAPEGFALHRGILTLAQVEQARRCSFGHGQRGVLQEPCIAAWVDVPTVRTLVERALSPRARPISGIWFDKQPEANWWVPWHRDLHVPVAPFVADGWGPWSDKDGIPHVQAPEPWRSRRVALRFHLDACTADQGALEVAAGTHRSPEQEHPAGSTTFVEVAAGDVLVMHPLILHRSRPARTPSHRRVVHLEWCDHPLPAGARWLAA